MTHMDIRETCCSVDKYELTFPSFSAVFIHTFIMEGDISVVSGDDPGCGCLSDKRKEMYAKLKNTPASESRPVSSFAEYLGGKVHFIRMENDVEELLFPSSSLDKNQIARYSVRGFDFRIPVRAAKEQNKDGEFIEDFPSVDFCGHANVEVSQFFGNIFSVTYRFLFDGFTCQIYEGCDDGEVDDKSRKTIEATTNHVIGLLSSCLGAEYWSDDDDDDDQKTDGIDLKNRLIINDIWLDAEGLPFDRDPKKEEPKMAAGQNDKEIELDDERDGVWRLEGRGRVFNGVLARYKKYLLRRFLGDKVAEIDAKKISVTEDSRYAMVDIWETVRHPFGFNNQKDLFKDDYWYRVEEQGKENKKLSEAGIINHIRDYHKPELVGLMSMYPAEWKYRAAEAYDEVCGENIAIDTDDLVLAGSHMAVVIGTYGRRGDGTEGVNWEKVMRGRRYYQVSWEEYLLIVQFVLAKKFMFNHAIDKLLKSTDDMSEVTKATLEECSKAALYASKKAIELDVIKHMKFPSHKVMYDRTMRRLDLENDFQRFKDVQEVVSGNLQSLGEYHAARADSRMNTLLVAISVVSLCELMYQENKWPFAKELFCSEAILPASVLSLIAGLLALIALGTVFYKTDFVQRLIRKNKK